MFKQGNLPNTVAIFPLPGAMLLPRVLLPLNIFEPRYLAMIEDTLKTSHRLIGVIQPRSDVIVGDESVIPNVGCAGRIVEFSETENGRYMVTLKGISRFKLGALEDGFLPYTRGDADWAGFEHDLIEAKDDGPTEPTNFFAILKRYFQTKQIDFDYESLVDLGGEKLVNSLSMICPFSDDEKQALLEADTLLERRKTLVALMEFALRGEIGERAIQ